MNLLTLAEVRERLWTVANQTSAYATATQAQLDDATFRINQVVERFLEEGKWKWTLRRIMVPIQDDGYIVIPREFETVLGVKMVTSGGCCRVSQVYSKFHEFAHNFTGCCSSGTYPISESAATFTTPTAPFTLRVVSTVTSGTITFYGGWDADGVEFFGGDAVSITNGTTNGTRTYSVMPPTGGVQKSVTTVPVSLYSVDSDGNETLIAIYAPTETVPAYKKYKVPDWNPSFINCLVLGKLAYIAAVNDYDIIIPSNWGALKLGLKALRAEDTEEDDDALRNWESAYRILNSQVTEAEGDNELPVFKMSPGTGCEGVLNLV